MQAACESDAESVLGAITFKVAESFEEVRAALALVHQSYLQAGLTRDNPYGLRLTPWHVLPTTEVFIAQSGDTVVGTVSLVRDGELGIPMESLYSEEVEVRRIMGLQIAEVSCLADRRNGLDQSFKTVSRLMSLILQAADRRGVERLLIAVHPRHARFYQRYIGFEVIGTQKTYGAVCDKPAVALELDLAHLKMKNPRAYQTFFGKPFPDSSLRRCPLDLEARAFLRQVYADSTRPLSSAAAISVDTSAAVSVC